MEISIGSVRISEVIGLPGLISAVRDIGGDRERERDITDLQFVPNL